MCWPVLDRNVRLVKKKKGFDVRKYGRVTRLAYAFKPHRWVHIDALGSTRTWERSLTFVSWAALDPIVPIETLTIVCISCPVELASGAFFHAMGCWTAFEPSVEQARAEISSGLLLCTIFQQGPRKNTKRS